METKTTKENQKLKLGPGDYVLFNGGLKIKNINKDKMIEIELPDSFIVSNYD